MAAPITILLQQQQYGYTNYNIDTTTSFWLHQLQYWSNNHNMANTIFIKKPFGFFKKGGEPLPSYKIWYNIFSEEIHKFQKLKAKRWELEKIGIFLIK